MSRSFDIDVELTVRITINDERVITAMLADEGGRNSGNYNLANEEELLHHLAFNAVANGQRDVSRLDGWADFDEDAASMTVDYGAAQFFAPYPVGEAPHG